MREGATRTRAILKLLALTCFLTLIFGCGCPREEIFFRIGSFDSRDDALREAIPRLAGAIKECPQVKTYRVVFIAPGIYRVDRHALLFYRRSSSPAWIGYEDDVFSGISPGFGPYEVDDSDVQSVARKGGSLEDFAQLDRAVKVGPSR